MNKRIVIFFLLLFLSSDMIAQEVPVSTEQQLENQTDADQAETEDDTWMQEMEIFKRNPLNLNVADADEIKQLRLLSDLQIASLISYRSLLGKLQSVYELQAVPAWDIASIKKILPFVTVGVAVSIKEDFRTRFTKGEHSFLIRVSQVFEKSRGFDKDVSGTKYTGSPQRLFFRYRYVYKNQLQLGMAGDKDAGEQFFKGVQKQGFDFYSMHLFARKIGVIQALALGDFTVNMGQGLIHWQSLAFKKSADVMGVKRQSAVLRPYSSAGEFYFHRGAGITVRKGKVEATVFASFRKLSANFVADTVGNEEYISSFLSSGYNRTVSEIENRNRLSQFAAGGNIAYKGKKLQIGASGIYYQFSVPVQKRNEPYNLYSISGSKWHNASIDYSYTYKNMHLFGEVAVDKKNNPAIINGLLMSVDTKADVSLMYRSISAGYQAVNGNAFTESAFPSNEKGMYAGLSLRPFAGWKLDGYYDVFRFPWLKYQADAASAGSDYMVQLTYTPSKQVEIYTRFRHESKSANQPENSTVTNYLVSLPRKNWRVQVNYRFNSAITFRNRAEMLWYDKTGLNKEAGFLIFQDIIYKPMLKPLSASLRLQYFDTDGYNSRLYAYENDVLYSYSIPAFFGHGIRYYLNASCDVSKKITIWIRFARTCYQDAEKNGSGLDEIPFSHKTEGKLQLRVLL